MGGNVKSKTVAIYKDKNENEPFTDWIESLRDKKGRRIILRRIGKMEHGLYGDCESVGGGVLELRIFFGPGYRIYFGEEAEHIILLLCGGNKDSQDRDIKKAKALWKEHKDNG